MKYYLFLLSFILYSLTSFTQPSTSPDQFPFYNGSFKNVYFHVGINGTNRSVDTSFIAAVARSLSLGASNYTAGAGINISGNIISATGSGIVGGQISADSVNETATHKVLTNTERAKLSTAVIYSDSVTIFATAYQRKQDSIANASAIAGKAANSATVTVNGNTQALGSNPNFTVAGGSGSTKISGDSITRGTTGTMFKIADSTTFAGKTDTSRVNQNADYYIELIGSTYYARPRYKSPLPAYSNTTFNSVMTSAMAALTTGGIIHIVRGTYTGLDFIVVTHSKIIIEGEGRYATILKMKNSADVGVTNFGTGFISTDSSNVTIRNLQLDGNLANQTKVDNNAGTTGVLVGIRSGGSFNKIEDCYIHDFPVYGIYVQSTGTTENKVTNCRVSNNGWNQITFDQTTTKCVADHCDVDGGGDVGISAYGQNHIITNNYVHDVIGTHGSTGSAWGIGVENFGATSNGTQIINNTVIGDSMLVGISLAQAYNAFVSGNTIHNIQGTKVTGGTIGIDINGGDSNQVSNNHIYIIRSNGIHIGHSNKNVVSENRVSEIGNGAATSSDGQGILVEGFSGNVSNNNVIKNNFSTGYYRGIFVTTFATGNIVRDNTLYGNQYADFLDNGTGTVKSNNFGILTGAYLPSTTLLGLATFDSTKIKSLIGTPTDLSFQTVTYASTISKAYDPTRPNFAITLTGNLSLSVTGASSGNSGIVNITRGSGSETLTFNGTVRGSTNYPIGSGVVVSMSYIAEPDSLAWYCNNPVTTAILDTVKVRQIVNDSAKLKLYISSLATINSQSLSAGGNINISGTATNDTIKPASSFSGNFYFDTIKHQIALKQKSGTILYFSAHDSIVPNAAPIASAVALVGNDTAGRVRSLTYTYTDAESNTESGTVKKYYTYTNTSGAGQTLVATASTYTIARADTGKYLRGSVTPGAATGTTPGAEVFSGYSGIIKDSAAVSALQNIVFPDFTNSSGIYTSSTNYATSVATKVLHGDGRVYAKFLTANHDEAVFFALGNNSANIGPDDPGEATAYAAGWRVRNNNTDIEKIDGGVTGYITNTATNGLWIAIQRTGSVIKLQTSSDETTWTDITTLTYSTTVDLYIHGRLSTAGTTLNNPKGTGLQ